MTYDSEAGQVGAAEQSQVPSEVAQCVDHDPTQNKCIACYGGRSDFGAAECPYRPFLITVKSKIYYGGKLRGYRVNEANRSIEVAISNDLRNVLESCRIATEESYKMRHALDD